MEVSSIDSLIIPFHNSSYHPSSVPANWLCLAQQAPRLQPPPLGTLALFCTSTFSIPIRQVPALALSFTSIFSTPVRQGPAWALFRTAAPPPAGLRRLALFRAAGRASPLASRCLAGSPGPEKLALFRVVARAVPPASSLPSPACPQANWLCFARSLLLVATSPANALSHRSIRNPQSTIRNPRAAGP